MKNKNQKIKVGSGVETHYGSNIRICISVEDLPEEHTFEYNGNTYIKLNVKKLFTADKFGKTHIVTVDTWKPNGHNQGKKTNSPSDDGMPF